MTSSPDLDLVADIGGTNTRVALARAGIIDRDSIRRFANKDAADLREILAQFMKQAGLRSGALSGICVAQMCQESWLIHAGHAKDPK